MNEADCKPVFEDSPALAVAMFEAWPCHTASVEELLRTPSADDLAALSEADLEQVRHWNPKTLGEIVFNWWD